MRWITNKANPFLTYAVVLFFVFDGLALGMNIWLTQRIQTQTIELNLAGRQRMLSQKMVKEFLYAPPGAANKAQLSQFTQTVNLFDRTLSAFRIGGSTIDTNNQLVTLDAIHERSYYNIVEETWGIWLPLRETALQYIASPTPTLFVELNQAFLQSNHIILNLMNDLALAIEQQARYETGQIRLLQTVALMLGMLNFLAAFLLYRLKLKTLEKEKSVVDALLNDMPAAMVFTSEEGSILKANPRFIQLIGVDFESIKQHKLKDLVEPHPKHDKYYQLSAIALNRAIIKTEQTTVQQDGEKIIVWRLEDASYELQERNSLSTLAYKDSLTGLDNRLAFEDHFNRQNKLANKEHLFALMFIDLNNFKIINDNFGHHKGDAVLKEVGFRLQALVTDTCHIARFGGDEFLVLQQHLDDEEKAIVLAQTIAEVLKQPFYIESDTLNIYASIGIVTFRGHYDSLNRLVSTADEAMYEAKSSTENISIKLLHLK
ncbi:diguanylate cyclase domain-containing protein [Marinomonas ostreistagni]|uniref:Diguanylate cyclase n=1 Tax=Marinomonas ostreistagni TaxID=359209 RepID=A0ABS0Z8S6_9GAMM|nr:diguanylate cyclase [Marinomonas ostreistagni]MBJ7550062.1 diguanylate cyclase [Marinomonas ostreistagni]